MRAFLIIGACVVALGMYAAGRAYAASDAAASTDSSGAKILMVGERGGGGGGRGGGGSTSMGGGNRGGSQGGGSWSGGTGHRGGGVGTFATPSFRGSVGTGVRPNVGASVGGNVSGGARVAPNPGVSFGARGHAAVSGGNVRVPANPGVSARLGVRGPSLHVNPGAVVDRHVHGQAHSGDHHGDNRWQTHRGYYPWGGWNRWAWGYPYYGYRYRYYPGYYYDYGYYPGYYGYSSYPGYYDYGQTPSPAVDATFAVRIVNPADTGATLNFAVNGQQYSLAPGQQQDLNVNAGSVIEFDRGGSGGTVAYSLSPGLYSFAQTPQGWELYNQSASGAAHTASPTTPGGATMY